MALPAVCTSSAIDFTSPFPARPSFKYSFESHPDSALTQMHNPASYAFTAIDTGVRDFQLYRLSEEKLIAGFNEHTAAADIFDQTDTFLIAAVEKHRFEVGFARIFPWIQMIPYPVLSGGCILRPTAAM